MGQAAALKLCVVMSTAWDARPWSDEKMALYSKSLADLDYGQTSRAISFLIKTSKWPPTVAEVRDLHDRFVGKLVAMAQHNADRKLLAAPVERDADGKLVALKPIRDVIKRLQAKLDMDRPRGVCLSPGDAAAVPMSDAERRERMVLLRAQARGMTQR